MTSPELHDTTTAAALLDVPAGWIAKLKHRRLITPASVLAGRGRRGEVPLYDIEELRPLAEKYHERRRRHARRGG